MIIPAAISIALALTFHSGPSPTSQPTAHDLVIAKALIAQADKEALKLGDHIASGRAFELWLAAHIRAGEWPAAKSIIDSCSAASRDQINQHACSAAVFAGNLQLARQILRDQVKREPYRDLCLGSIAQGEAIHGQVGEASADLKHVTDPNTRFDVLRELAFALTKSGDHAAARAACDEMETLARQNPSAVIRGRNRVIETLAQIGEVDVAKKLVDESSDPAGRQSADSALAQGRARAGDLSWIISATKGNGGGNYLGPGTYLAMHGDLTDAKKLAGFCTNPTFADDLRCMIGSVEARTGDIPAALATAALIQKRISGRIFIYYKVVQTQVRTGDTKGAAETLSLMRKNANALSGTQRTSADSSIAYAEAALGDVDGAIAAFSRLSGDPAELMYYYSYAAEFEMQP